MAVEANVNFSDDDDQDYNENDTGDTSFDPSTFGDEDSLEATQPEALEIDAPPVGDNVEPHNPEVKQKPIDVEKLVDAEIRKMDQANRRQLREQQAEERRLLKEAHEDELRRMREQKRQEKAAVQEQITATRSNAITQRVQAYSVSSALGLPGYIGAAAFDQFIIRPEEKQQVDENKAYQAALDNYYRQLEKDRIAEKRDEEERIRQMPVQAVDVDAIKAKHGVPPAQPQAPPPPTNQPQQQPQATQAQQTQQPASGGAPPSSPPPPNTTTGQQPQRDPEPVRPLPPIPPQATNIGSAAQIAAIAFQAAQMINGSVRDVGEQAGKTVNATLEENPYEAARQHSKFAQKAIDPFGVNVPLQVAVTGFDQLLSITEEIKKLSEKDISFSPLSLSASVEGDIQKLVQQIEIAQKLDPTKAEVIKLNNQIELAWNEFRAEVFENIAPHIITLLTILKGTIEVGTEIQKDGFSVMDFLGNPLYQGLSHIQQALDMIAKNTKPTGQGAALDKNGLMAQIARFTDPDQVQPFNRPAVHPNP